MTQEDQDEVTGGTLAVVGAASVYERAVESVVVALQMTREQLAEKRAEKERLRLEIKDLVAEEQLLQRMEQVAASRMERLAEVEEITRQAAAKNGDDDDG